MARNRVILLPSVKMTTCSSWSMLRRKRRTLWRNTPRNQLIARVGKICLEQDKQALREMGISAKRAKNNVVWTCRIVILVESSEHAYGLQSLLPSWELLDTVPNLEPEDEPEEPGTLITSGCIVTWMHAMRYDLKVDYFIRATGWRGCIDLSGEENWLAPPKRRLTIIDFDDAWDLQANMDTEARIRDYREQYLEVIRTKEPVNT
jgi:hypothetical protein